MVLEKPLIQQSRRVLRRGVPCWRPYRTMRRTDHVAKITLRSSDDSSHPLIACTVSFKKDIDYKSYETSDTERHTLLPSPPKSNRGQLVSDQHTVHHVNRVLLLFPCWNHGYSPGSIRYLWLRFTNGCIPWLCWERCQCSRSSIRWVHRTTQCPTSITNKCLLIPFSFWYRPRRTNTNWRSASTYRNSAVISTSQWCTHITNERERGKGCV